MPHRGLTILVAVMTVACAPDPQPNKAPSAALTLVSETVELPGGDLIAAEIGMLRVPERRGADATKLISIEISRFGRADGADPTAPPVFLLPGGPGFPGIRPMLERGDTADMIDLITPVTDLIIVAQRGIGPSDPSLACEERIVTDVSVAVDKAAFADVMRSAASACRQRWLDEGVDLAAYNIIEAATDVRDAATAMGYDKIALWGVSFGSHWSMAVMRYHGDIVARVLLSGLEGPDHTYDMPSGVLASITRMAAEADTAAALADHVPEGGFLAGFKRVVEHLGETPVTVTATHPTTSEESAVFINDFVARQAAYGLRGRISSRSGMVTWPGDVLSLIDGDYSVLAAGALMQADRGLPPAAFFTLDCGSGITPDREAKLDADPAQEVLGNLSMFYQSVCPAWDVDVGDDFRTGFSSDIPTLMVHGTYDTNTPYDNALEMQPALTHSHLVTVIGGSHGALAEAVGHDSSFVERVLRFLVTGNLDDMPETIELPPIEWVVPQRHPGH